MFRLVVILIIGSWLTWWQQPVDIANSPSPAVVANSTPVVFYSGFNYTGEATSVTTDLDDDSARTWLNRVRSVRLAPTVALVGCASVNLTGLCRVWNSSQPTLGWFARGLQSFSIENTTRAKPALDLSPAVIVLYDERNYDGVATPLGLSATNSNTAQMSSLIQSIRIVSPGVELVGFEGVNCTGRRHVWTGDAPELGDLDIMSYRVNAIGAPITLVTIGDSITLFGSIVDDSGWVWMLEQDYKPSSGKVVNRGIGGWTSRRWAPHLAHDILEWGGAPTPPDLVTICLGANDAVLPALDPGLQHVDVHEYIANLDQMVAHLHSTFPSCKVLLITPPAVNNALTFESAQPTAGSLRENNETGRYAAAMVALGLKLGVPVVNLWNATQGQMYLFSDGLHFSIAGNQHMHQLVLESIKTNFPTLAP